jgi:hypothetical protein
MSDMRSIWILRICIKAYCYFLAKTLSCSPCGLSVLGVKWVNLLVPIKNRLNCVICVGYLVREWFFVDRNANFL